MRKCSLGSVPYYSSPSTEELLHSLSPQRGAGHKILMTYARWLEGRQPAPYCDSKFAKMWREHQFKKAAHYLQHLSEMMVE